MWMLPETAVIGYQGMSWYNRSPFGCPYRSYNPLYIKTKMLNDVSSYRKPWYPMRVQQLVRYVANMSPRITSLKIIFWDPSRLWAKKQSLARSIQAFHVREQSAFNLLCCHFTSLTSHSWDHCDQDSQEDPPLTCPSVYSGKTRNRKQETHKHISPQTHKTTECS